MSVDEHVTSTAIMCHILFNSWTYHSFTLNYASQYSASTCNLQDTFKFSTHLQLDSALYSLEIRQRVVATNPSWGFSADCAVTLLTGRSATPFSIVSKKGALTVLPEYACAM